MYLQMTEKELSMKVVKIEHILQKQNVNKSGAAVTATFAIAPDGIMDVEVVSREMRLQRSLKYPVYKGEKG